MLPYQITLIFFYKSISHVQTRGYFQRVYSLSVEIKWTIGFVEIKWTIGFVHLINSVSSSSSLLWKAMVVVISINACALFWPAYTKNHSPTSNSHQPICTKTHNDWSLPLDLTSITNGLISPSTKQPFSPHKTFVFLII